MGNIRSTSQAPERNSDASPSHPGIAQASVRDGDQGAQGKRHSTLHAAAIDFDEFRRGWIILLLSMLGVTTMVSATILYGFGALMLPLQEAKGWSRADLQPAISFMFLGVVLASQAAGWLNLRYGVRKVTLTSLTALSIGYLLMTQIGDSIWELYLGFTLLSIAGVGTLQVTWTYLVNLWFERNRGLALALILCGTGISAGIMPALITWSVHQWDWRGGFVVMTCVTGLVTLPMVWRWLHTSATITSHPAAAAVRDSNALPVAAALTGFPFREALRKRQFWILNLALVLVVSSVVGLITNIVPLLVDRGLSPMAASQVFGAFGLSLITGRLLVGYLSDRFWAPGVGAVALFLPAIGCVLFATVESSIPLFVLATLLVGIGTGAEFDIASFLVARYFGMRDYGRLFGVHLGISTTGAALGPLLFGSMFHSTGSYLPMLIYCTICYVVGPLLILTLGPYPKLK
jgi:MFS family permease